MNREGHLVNGLRGVGLNRSRAGDCRVVTGAGGPGKLTIRIGIVRGYPEERDVKVRRAIRTSIKLDCTVAAIGRHRQMSANPGSSYREQDRAAVMTLSRSVRRTVLECWVELLNLTWQRQPGQKYWNCCAGRRRVVFKLSREIAL